jgi:hypothetical protein
MAEDKEVKNYFENMPYGNDALSSEIHGKRNQVAINKMIASLVRNYDKQMAVGNKENANHFKSMIYKIQKDLDNLKGIKEEFARNYGGGTGGKNLYSNWTDLSFDRSFFIERGEILFDEQLKPLLSVKKEDGQEYVKHIEEITQNWVIRGTEEQDFMRMQQDAVKQRNTMGNELDFDVDWEVSKMLENESKWKVFASDKIGGRYFLNDYVEENQAAIESGEIPDEMLDPESFNPETDTRLHDYFATRLRKAFDPDYQSTKEKQKESNIETSSTDSNIPDIDAITASMENNEKMKAIKQGRA